jgi:hypothetical protein
MARGRTAWLTRHPPPWDAATHRAYAELFGQAIDRWLDTGDCSCLLGNRRHRTQFAVCSSGSTGHAIGCMLGS